MKTATLGILALLLALMFPCAGARAQSTTYTLDEGGWVEGDAPEPGTDEARIAEARQLIAEQRYGAAKSILSEFIRRNETSSNPLLPQAYRLRGDARTASGDEFKALYDYEAVIRSFPASEEVAVAVEREFEIAKRYAAGMRKKWFGLRIEPANDLAIEIFIRTQERLPGSALAEQAAIALADYYFDRRDWVFAAETYDLYLLNFPQGPNAIKAQKRRIYSEVAGYGGPSRDTRPLIEARERIRRFARLYPAEAEATGLNEQLIERVDESLAEQMLVTSRWYLRVGDDPSARFTLRRLVGKYPTSQAARTGMDIMDDRGWSYTLPTPDGRTGPSGFESGEPGEQVDEGPALDEQTIPPSEAVPSRPELPETPQTPGAPQ
ncbi:MAG: outer membrane protein assembly factor BamD [Phycisphaerales bacterium]